MPRTVHQRRRQRPEKKAAPEHQEKSTAHEPEIPPSLDPSSGVDSQRRKTASVTDDEPQQYKKHPLQVEVGTWRSVTGELRRYFAQPIFQASRTRAGSVMHLTSTGASNPSYSAPAFPPFIRNPAGTVGRNYIPNVPTGPQYHNLIQPMTTGMQIPHISYTPQPYGVAKEEAPGTAFYSISPEYFMPTTISPTLSQTEVISHIATPHQGCDNQCQHYGGYRPSAQIQQHQQQPVSGVPLHANFQYHQMYSGAHLPPTTVLPAVQSYGGMAQIPLPGKAGDPSLYPNVPLVIPCYQQRLPHAMHFETGDTALHDSDLSSDGLTYTERAVISSDKSDGAQISECSDFRLGLTCADEAGMASENSDEAQSLECSDLRFPPRFCIQVAISNDDCEVWLKEHCTNNELPDLGIYIDTAEVRTSMEQEATECLLDVTSKEFKTSACKVIAVATENSVLIAPSCNFEPEADRSAVRCNRDENEEHNWIPPSLRTALEDKELRKSGIMVDHGRELLNTTYGMKIQGLMELMYISEMFRESQVSTSPCSSILQSPSSLVEGWLVGKKFNPFGSISFHTPRIKNLASCTDDIVGQAAPMAFAAFLVRQEMSIAASSLLQFSCPDESSGKSSNSLHHMCEGLVENCAANYDREDEPEQSRQ